MHKTIGRRRYYKDTIFINTPPPEEEEYDNLVIDLSRGKLKCSVYKWVVDGWRIISGTPIPDLAGTGVRQGGILSDGKRVKSVCFF